LHYHSSVKNLSTIKKKKFDVLEERVEKFRSDNKKPEEDFSQDLNQELFNLLKRFGENKE
jgi:hypothetical protein